MTDEDRNDKKHTHDCRFCRLDTILDSSDSSASGEHDRLCPARSSVHTMRPFPFDPHEDILDHVSISMDWQVESYKQKDFFPMNLRIITSESILFDEINRFMPKRIAILGHSIQEIDVLYWTDEEAENVCRIKRDLYLGSKAFKEFTRVLQAMDASSDDAEFTLVTHWNTNDGQVRNVGEARLDAKKP